MLKRWGQKITINRFGRPFWKSPFLLVCLSMGVVLLALVSLTAMRHQKNAAEPTWLDISGEDTPADSSFEKEGQWYGLCRRDSIRSVEDFRRTVANDETLRVHFADFKWEKASIKQLEKPVFAYVYFRKADTVFRKAKPMGLPAGDEYITDGKTRVRTHCCNDYTEAPPLVASDSEFPPAPAEETPLPFAPSLAFLSNNSEGTPGLIIPPPPTSSLPSTSAAAGFIVGTTKGNDDPTFPQDPPPVIPPPVTPPTPVPEPGASLLLGVGFGAMLLFVFFRRRRSRI
jgi:hypothetical protein